MRGFWTAFAPAALGLALSACGGGGQAVDVSVEKPIQLPKDGFHVAAGAGAAWVAGEGTVMRIDPRSRRVVATIPVGENTGDVTVGEGGVWVIAVRGDAKTLVRIDPQSNEVAGKPLEVGLNYPKGIATGAGSIWIANEMDDSVTRVDPESNRISGEPISLTDATDIAVGGGSVWATRKSADAVTRIDPRTDKLVGQAIPVGVNPTGIAFGEGGVWVGNSGDATVTRIDPRSGSVVGEPIEVGTLFAVDVLAVGEGAVWVPDTDLGKVNQIDPKVNEVVGEAVELGSMPRDIAAGEGAVWVLTDDKTVVPLEPR